MKQVVFYEKPGCMGNKQQKVRLRHLGIELEVRDLLAEPWSKETLRPFFAETPVAEWFNSSAPQVKSGEIDIHALTESQALALMLEEALLIRRPLLQLNEIRQSGFVSGPVLSALGVSLSPDEDLQSCPMPETDNSGGTQGGQVI